MFQIGFWELVVVDKVTLCVMGHEKLPAIARLCARQLSQLKKYALVLKNELDNEFKS